MDWSAASVPLSALIIAVAALIYSAKGLKSRTTYDFVDMLKIEVDELRTQIKTVKEAEEKCLERCIKLEQENHKLLRRIVKLEDET